MNKALLQVNSPVEHLPWITVNPFEGHILGGPGYSVNLALPQFRDDRLSMVVSDVS